MARHTNWSTAWSEAVQRDLAKLERQVAARRLMTALPFAEVGPGGLGQSRLPLAGHRLRPYGWHLAVRLDESEPII